MGEEEEDSDKKEFLAQLPMYAEAEAAVVEQRAILALFERQRRNQSAQELMATERRVAAARLVEEHAAARADADHHNIKAARAAIAAAKQRLLQADVTGGLATVAAERQQREHQYPLPSFDALAQREEERHTFTSFLEDAECRRRERVSEEPSLPWDGFLPPVR
jgi:hypothetical protein